MNFLFSCSKSRAQREREERQREEELLAQQQREAELAAGQGPFTPPGDPTLMKYIEEVQERVAPLPSTKHQVVALAQLVHRAMVSES